MGVVKRDGKWRLEKKKQGVYLVSERKESKAKIITSEYEPEGMLSDESSGEYTVELTVTDSAGEKTSKKKKIQVKKKGLLERVTGGRESESETKNSPSGIFESFINSIIGVFS